jgi:hypothetical protein
MSIEETSFVELRCYSLPLKDIFESMASIGCDDQDQKSFT